MSNIITDLKELREKNSNATPEEGKKIVSILSTTLTLRSGLGLAAPQIGIHKRVAIIRTSEAKIDLINPMIIEMDRPFTNFLEGCLSIPNKRFNTRRYNEIFVKDDLHPYGIIVGGETAVAVFHEIDHLDGILIIDRSVGKDKLGRNDQCPCGRVLNGKPVKWKKCHGKY